MTLELLLLLVWVGVCGLWLLNMASRNNRK